MKKIKQPTFRSEKFTLRPFKKGDEKTLMENANDKEIARNVGEPFPTPYRLSDANFWINIQEERAREKERTDYSFAIEVDGECAGSISLMNIVTEHKAEIGYWLGKKFWGRGIMTEALKLVTKFGFNDLKLKRIFGGVAGWNKGSARVLEKQGYKFEGELRKDFKDRKTGKFVSSFLYAKTKS